MKPKRDSITFKGEAANEAFLALAVSVQSARLTEAPCVVENNDKWLKAQCNRRANGICQTRACLMRGGYVGGPVNYTKATCEAHEILCELEGLRLAALKAETVHQVRCPKCGNYYGGHATGGDDICCCHMPT